MNNESTFAAKEKALKDGNYTVAVNSIQKALFVERLYVNIAYPADRIIPYDYDNLYPNKVKSIAKRSGTTLGAIEKLAEYISGAGFAQMSQKVNRKGQNLWDLLRFIAYQKSMFDGVALHFNYNLLGQITEINPVNFEFVRWKKDLKKFIVNPDWFRRNRRKEEFEYWPFNPSRVIEQINECGGIDNYNGQLYYWIPNLADYYTTCAWDAVLDDAQFEAETKLYSLSSVQNDYSLGGYSILPKNLVDDKQIDEYKDELKKDKGAANAGGLRVFASMPNEVLQHWKWFQPISRNNIDSLHTNQIERAKFNIYAKFKLPPILCGVATSGMFNQESFLDAFNYYNSATETDRKDVERELNRIIQASVWAGIGNIEIQPKVFIARGEKAGTEEPKDINAEAQATLRGSVGGVQGILQIQQSVSQGLTDYNAAIAILKEIFGFDELKSRAILGTPELKQSNTNF